MQIGNGLSCRDFLVKPNDDTSTNIYAVGEDNSRSFSLSCSVSPYLHELDNIIGLSSLYNPPDDSEYPYKRLYKIVSLDQTYENSYALVNYAKELEYLVQNPLSDETTYDEDEDEDEDIDSGEVTKYSIVVNIVDNSISTRYDSELIHGVFKWKNLLFVLG